MEEFFKNTNPSPPPEGKQKIMEKYTKLCMKHLYGKDILVFFYTGDHPFAMNYRGIFMDESTPPHLVRDYPIWAKDPKCSVTYDGLLYRPDELAPHAWNTIVHEVSHYEIGVKSKINSKGYQVTTHTKKFNEIYKRNLKKVDDLRKQFNEEVGLDK